MLCRCLLCCLSLFCVAVFAFDCLLWFVDCVCFVGLGGFGCLLGGVFVDLAMAAMVLVVIMFVVLVSLIVCLLLCLFVICVCLLLCFGLMCLVFMCMLCVYWCLCGWTCSVGCFSF